MEDQVLIGSVELRLKLLALAKKWEQYESTSPGDYGNGQESATRSCGEELRELMESAT